MKLKVTRKGHNRYEGDGLDKKVVTYKVGDTFEGTERELAAFKDRLTSAEGEAPKGGKQAKGGEGGGQ